MITGQRRQPRRIVRIVVLGALVVSLSAAGVGGVSPVRGDELSDARDRAEALAGKIAKQKRLLATIEGDQEALRSAIRDTKAELTAVTTDLGIVRDRIARAEVAVGHVRATVEVLVAEVAGLDDELARLTAQEARKRQDLGDRRAELAERIRAAYDADRTSMLETFLSGAAFTDILAEVSYQLDVAEQDRKLAEEIVQEQAALAAVQLAVSETRAATDLLRKETAAQERELSRQLKGLKEARARLKRLVAATDRALEAQRSSYERLAHDSASLKAAMAKATKAKRALEGKIDDLIRQQAGQGKVPSKFSGTLSWPMPGAVSQDFGCTGFGWEPTVGDCRGFHSGIDIVAPYGTAVRAAGAGRIAYVGWNYADGADPAWIVVIAHSASLQTWYAHMQARVPAGIKAGAVVRAGQVIGYEGNTGRSTGAHLHWAVRRNGTFVNPRSYL